jgi:sugar transferase (PEP-CTERM system associated)
VIWLFKVYYRRLLLAAGEALIVWFSFVVAAGVASWLSEAGWPEPRPLRSHDPLFTLKVFAVTAIMLLFSHFFDRYTSTSLAAKWDPVVPLLKALGSVALALAVVTLVYRLRSGLGVGLPGRAEVLEVIILTFILTFTLLGWRGAYSWMVQRPFLRERVYVLGTGERAQRLVKGLGQRPELGIEVVGWTGNVQGEVTRDSAASHLLGVVKGKGVERVIVAMPDRRGTLPVWDLLELRQSGVKVEEATNWLEKVYEKIEVEDLNPSWLIFAEGFQFNTIFRRVRRMLSFSVALVGLLLSLPLFVFAWVAVKVFSPGPAFYKQQRVGREGKVFNCYKFRTMRQDAEADTGATWATDDDPRITRVGKFLRVSRLDEIPQLWCVLKGDMHFVGPRPERPEFVKWLEKEIPFYRVRHMVRPGITGWAQVRYKYGNTLDDAREKLQYDLFYIKNASLGLDLWIMFQTIKTVILGRGAQ